MAIKVNLESTIIPVEIGDLKFEIDVADEKYETLVNNFNDFLEKVEALDEENPEDISQLKAIVKDIYDEMLGENAYEQIYTKMPNISFVTGVLVNIVTQLAEEVDKRVTPTPSLKAVKKSAKK